MLLLLVNSFSVVSIKCSIFYRCVKIENFSISK